MTTTLRHRRPPRLAALLAVAAVTGACALALPATAQNADVYLTYTAEDLGPSSGWVVGIPPGSSVPLHLWIQGGGSASTGGPCQLGATGNEICAVNVRLDGNGFFTFLDFLPSPSFDSSPGAVPVLASVTPSRIILNALDFGAPGLGNRYLGVINVGAIGNPTPEDGLSVSGGVMRSNMEMWPITARDVAVPEPAFGASLALGAMVLGLRRRLPRGAPDRRA